MTKYNIGDRSGSWVLLERIKGTGYGKFRCDCGKVLRRQVSSILGGNSSSCYSCASTTHGESTSIEGQAWYSMMQRCHNPSHKFYAMYGGRGIHVHPAWRNDIKSFCMWVRDNLGDRPAGHSLDRIDNNKGYEPGNLRWADQKTQIANSRVVGKTHK